MSWSNLLAVMAGRKRRPSVAVPSVAGPLVAGMGAAVALALGGCAASSPAVRVQQADSGVPACRSFEWLPVSKDAASLNEQRIRAAVMARLQEKGYAQSAGPTASDCRITYVMSLSAQEPAKPRVGVGAGGGSRGIGGGIGVSLPIGRKKQQSGTVTLDVIDVASNAQVWSGSLDASFAQAELSDDEASAVARKILAEFPDARATPLVP